MGLATVSCLIIKDANCADPRHVVGINAESRKIPVQHCPGEPRNNLQLTMSANVARSGGNIGKLLQLALLTLVRVRIPGAKAGPYD
jgi:hypothetical protein